MGHEIRLETENGEIIERLSDGSERLHRLLLPPTDKGFCLLGFVDFFGNTVFNRPQMEKS